MAIKNNGVSKEKRFTKKLLLTESYGGPAESFGMVPQWFH